MEQGFTSADPLSPHLQEVLSDVISEDVGHPTLQNFTDSSAQKLGVQLKELYAGGACRETAGREVEDQTTEEVGLHISQTIFKLKVGLLSLIEDDVII